MVVARQLPAAATATTAAAATTTTTTTTSFEEGQICLSHPLEEGEPDPMPSIASELTALPLPQARAYKSSQTRTHLLGI